jgi:heme exporter protein CcmD
MEYGSYVFAGYVVVFGSIGAYAWHVLRRGRRLSREVPPSERRWM